MSLRLPLFLSSATTLMSLFIIDFVNFQVKAEPQATSRKRKAESKPKSVSKKRKLEDNLLPEPLDRTMIHPESYEVTYKYVVYLY